jgi:YbbR domain-containing protein
MIGSFVRFLYRNVGTLILAFALAMVVWISSVVAADPNETCVSPSVVPLEVLGENPALERMVEIPSQIQVEFFAPHSICVQLSQNGAGTATIDMSGLGPGANTVRVAPPVPTLQPVRVLGFSPTEITVSLERLVTETFPITLDLTGEPALGFEAGVASLDVKEVTVSGPESLVAQVAEVRASLDIGGTRETIQRNLGLRVVDSEGNTLNGLTLSPGVVVIDLAILQLGRYRELAVQVKTTGQWATGYRLTSITVSPPTVTVFSEDSETVTNLPGFVETAPIDLTDASDDISANVNLNLPPGVSLVGRETVFVQVSIAAIQGNLIINLPVEVIGLSPELGIEISPDNVDVILFGPLPVLEELTAANVRVVVDVTGLGEGTWQVSPLVDILPDDVTEQGINPGVLEVVIVLLPTPTPSPTLSTIITPTLAGEN